MKAPGEIPTALMQALFGGVCLTIDELDASVDLNRRQISAAAGQLVLRGLAERVERGCYQLTKAGIAAVERGEVITSGPYRPHTAPARRAAANTLRQRAWNAMRMSGTFTLADIVMAAAQASDGDPDANVKRYVRQLALAEYVVELPVRGKGTALTSNGFKRFRLIKNTGPIAPVARIRSKTVHDHNLARQAP